MITLNPIELECLRRVSEGHCTIEPCRADVLAVLLRGGLIEYAPDLRLPLARAQSSYHLTEAGWCLLKGLAN